MQVDRSGGCCRIRPARRPSHICELRLWSIMFATVRNGRNAVTMVGDNFFYRRVLCWVLSVSCIHRCGPSGGIVCWHVGERDGVMGVVVASCNVAAVRQYAPIPKASSELCCSQCQSPLSHPCAELNASTTARRHEDARTTPCVPRAICLSRVPAQSCAPTAVQFCNTSRQK